MKWKILCKDLLFLRNFTRFSTFKLSKGKIWNTNVCKADIFSWTSELFPDEGQADLETENTPDGMDGEQTWPTEEELREAEMEGKLSLLNPLIIF